jgi:hypothetical protein
MSAAEVKPKRVKIKSEINQPKEGIIIIIFLTRSIYQLN